MIDAQIKCILSLSRCVGAFDATFSTPSVWSFLWDLSYKSSFTKWIQPEYEDDENLNLIYSGSSSHHPHIEIFLFSQHQFRQGFKSIADLIGKPGQQLVVPKLEIRVFWQRRRGNKCLLLLFPSESLWGKRIEGGNYTAILPYTVIMAILPVVFGVREGFSNIENNWILWQDAS